MPRTQPVGRQRFELPFACGLQLPSMVHILPWCQVIQSATVSFPLAQDVYCLFGRLFIGVFVSEANPKCVSVKPAPTSYCKYLFHKSLKELKVLEGNFQCCLLRKAKPLKTEVLKTACITQPRCNFISLIRCSFPGSFGAYQVLNLLLRTCLLQVVFSVFTSVLQVEFSVLAAFSTLP